MTFRDRTTAIAMEPDQPAAAGKGWRVSSQTPSLQEVHRTIPVPQTLGFWREMLAFSGPGYLVAVGYNCSRICCWRT